MKRILYLCERGRSLLGAVLERCARLVAECAIDDQITIKKPRCGAHRDGGACLQLIKLLSHWLTSSCSVISYGYMFAITLGAPSLQSTRLLDQLDVCLHYWHYSLENAY